MCEYAFDPGTLPPGAQSLGEHESIVSHTRPRVPRAAGTLLDRLVQVIWTEPPQEEPENQASGDEPLPDDADMQVDTEEGSEATGMAMDSAPLEDPANTPVDTGDAGEKHDNGNTYVPSHASMRRWRDAGSQQLPQHGEPLRERTCGDAGQQ